jgi:hypothetical protein
VSKFSVPIDAESAPPAGRQAQSDEAERSISC